MAGGGTGKRHSHPWAGPLGDADHFYHLAEQKHPGDQEELLAERCGEKRIDSRGAGFYAFPEPAALAALSEDDLKSCKLGYRCKYVHAAAEAVSNRDIDLLSLLAADEVSTINALTKLFGVGTKVANCVSLFGLHHVNAFPVDVWIRRVLDEQYPNGYPYKKYAPYNGIYQQYMFAYYRHM